MPDATNWIAGTLGGPLEAFTRRTATGQVGLPLRAADPMPDYYAPLTASKSFTRFFTPRCELRRSFSAVEFTGKWPVIVVLAEKSVPVSFPLTAYNHISLRLHHVEPY